MCVVVQDDEVCCVMKRRLQVRSRAGPASIEVEKAVPFAAAAAEVFRYGDGGKKRRREHERSGAMRHTKMARGLNCCAEKGQVALVLVEAADFAELATPSSDT